ncbi:MAG: NADH-quinone oxidoreductase subunit [Chloroflexota bacterium]|jgi:NADH-quinone oxidoreductase subunit D|nr:NADH-quinone oxidoreductase subunit [Chloroflexota bacterium]
MEIPVGLQEELIQEGELLTINMGPQHPSTHGVFRMILTLDGETVVSCRPVMGYLHRSVEKLAESRTYMQDIIFTDRLDYLAPMTTNLPFAMATEQLAGLEVPERAQLVRVIMCELQRFASHCVAIGTFANDTGAFHTALMYTFRERERILDIYDEACGARMTVSYIRYGGVARDLTDDALRMIREFVADMDRNIDEFESMMTDNEIFKARTQGIGALSADDAIANSITGPMLRASGVPYDVRKAEPYSLYERFDFDIPTRRDGDCYDRYMVRVAEMRQTRQILEQALKDLPEGPVMGKVPKVFRPAKGYAYARTESPKGEIGVYLVSDGKTEPYRFHIRPPSFINLGVLSNLVVGNKVADAVVILGSIDIVMGEVDR